MLPQSICRRLHTCRRAVSAASEPGLEARVAYGRDRHFLREILAHCAAAQCVFVGRCIEHPCEVVMAFVRCGQLTGGLAPPRIVPMLGARPQASAARTTAVKVAKDAIRVRECIAAIQASARGGSCPAGLHGKCGQRRVCRQPDVADQSRRRNSRACPSCHSQRPRRRGNRRRRGGDCCAQRRGGRNAGNRAGGPRVAG